MKSETAYLSLGSNTGDRAAHLQSALERLTGHPEIQLLRVSSWYETEPQDFLAQPWFLNLCVAITTSLAPRDLLEVLQGIERKEGRARVGTIRRGPRPLDIDILLYGSVAMATTELTIPHPRMWERRFVLVPLLEIAPELVHPEGIRPLHGFLEDVKGQALRKYFP